MGVVPGGAIWLFTDKTEVVSKAATSFNRGQVQGIDVHGMWISGRARGLWVRGVVISGHLGGSSSVHEGDSVSDLLLEAEVGGFVVPPIDGGGDGIHSLNMVHDPCQDSCFEIQDKGGSVLDLVVLGIDNIELELVGIFLELVS